MRHKQSKINSSNQCSQVRMCVHLPHMEVLDTAATVSRGSIGNGSMLLDENLLRAFPTFVLHQTTIPSPTHRKHFSRQLAITAQKRIRWMQKTTPTTRSLCRLHTLSTDLRKRSATAKPPLAQASTPSHKRTDVWFFF